MRKKTKSCNFVGGGRWSRFNSAGVLLFEEFISDYISDGFSDEFSDQIKEKQLKWFFKIAGGFSGELRRHCGSDFEMQQFHILGFKVRNGWFQNHATISYFRVQSEKGMISKPVTNQLITSLSGFFYCFMEIVWLRFFLKWFRFLKLGMVWLRIW